MTFKFTCPQGHLLEVETEQAGQQSICPACGTRMIIPQPEGVPTAQDRSRPLPEIQTGQPSLPTAAVGDVPNFQSAPEILHIPCPSGHVLGTPPEMIGKYAMCPECHAKFQLLQQDSEEFKRTQQIEREAQQQRLAHKWLNWAVMLVIFVLLGLSVLILVGKLSS